MRNRVLAFVVSSTKQVIAYALLALLQFLIATSLVLVAKAVGSLITSGD